MPRIYAKYTYVKLLRTHFAFVIPPDSPKYTQWWSRTRAYVFSICTVAKGVGSRSRRGRKVTFATRDTTVGLRMIMCARVDRHRGNRVSVLRANNG